MVASNGLGVRRDKAMKTPLRSVQSAITTTAPLTGNRPHRGHRVVAAINAINTMHATSSAAGTKSTR